MATRRAKALRRPKLVHLSLTVVSLLGSSLLAQEATRLAPSAERQIAALLAEKASRSPSQMKIDSGLLRAVRERRGQPMAPGVSLPPVAVAAPDGTVTLDLKAAVSDGLLARLSALGARDVAPHADHGTVRATIALEKVEAIAAFPEVRWVDLAAEGAAASYNVPVSEGDKTHRAYDARHTFGYDGTGVRIGVLSDSVDFLSRSQLSGNLGAVTVLPGQSGVPRAGEGTAMLEIVHDVAPGAQLFFATSTGGVANMAANIQALAAPPYSCDLIVDDWFYFDESPFQDGPIAQAVNSVTASGVLYVSAAQNDGNLDASSSGTWEGDFVNGGTLSAVPGGNVHSFGGGVSDVVTQGSGYNYVLFWSDALGASSNDYDLFILDSTLTNVLDSSTNTQSGTQDPYERTTRYVTSGDRVVILQRTGAASRFLHLQAFRGKLGTSTAGAVKGHAAAADALATAATTAVGPYPSPFTSAATVEAFSSDGPRRMFYSANGTAYTAGNFSSSGGTVRQKPDITAADGVTTSVPSFTAYYGTSAAASHAAAIAALVKSANHSLTASQVKSLLVSNAIDIGSAGADRDSGAGVVMAYPSVAATGAPPVANLAVTGVALAEASGGNGNGGVEPGESGNLTVTLTNGGALNATSVAASLALAAPISGVSVTAAGPFAVGGGTVAPNASAANATAFTIHLDGSVPCGLTIPVVLSVSFGGGAAGASPLSLGFLVETGAPVLAMSQTLDASAPSSTSLYTASSGLQTGMLNMDERVATCENPKTAPNVNASGSRRYDAFTFTNTSPSTRCVSVSLSSSCNSASASRLFLAAYDASGFDPSNPASHYLADAGTTALGDETLSFDVAASTSYTIVVHEVTPGATSTSACPYVLHVDGLPCGISVAAHGDVNGDGQITVSDVFWLISYLFAGGPAPLGYADVTGDGQVTVSDAFWLINYLFAGGPAPK